MIESFKKEYIYNYSNFTGRTNRIDFWLAVLGYCFIYFLIGLLSYLPIKFDIRILISIFLMLSFIPSLALGVRRLHDVNKSGWFLLLSLIPFLGQAILILWFCGESINQNNNY